METVTPLPLSLLNLSTIDWSAVAFEPVCVCQSVMLTGPARSMSASVLAGPP